MTRGVVWLVATAFVASACDAQADPAPAGAIQRVAVSSSASPLLDDLLSTYDNVSPNATFDVQRGNAETVATALRDGRADWGLVTFLPADSDLWSVPVGTDGLAVVVHPNNPVNAISLRALRTVYEGRVFSWTELDGSDEPLTVVGRERGSAGRGAFDEVVMGGLPTTPTARLATTSAAVVTQVVEQPGAIGYVTLARVDARVKALAVDGVFPTRETVQSGEYGLVSAVRFVALDEPEGESADFLRWVLSDEGQMMVGMRYAPLVR